MTDTPAQPTPDRPQPVTAVAATLLPDGVGVDSFTGPIGYYVQAHDGVGRAVYDSRGYPVLVRAKDQGGGLNATRSLRILVWIQIILLISALIVGIVGAVELHHLATPTVDTDPFGSLRAPVATAPP